MYVAYFDQRRSGGIGADAVGVAIVESAAGLWDH